MSRFEELSRLLASIEKENEELEKLSKEFVMDLDKKLVEYLGCREGEIKYYESTDNYRNAEDLLQLVNQNHEEPVPPSQALKLHVSDKLWYFGLVITVYSILPNKFIEIPFLLSVKPRGTKFLLNTTIKERLVSSLIDPNVEEGFQSFFNCIFNKIENDIYNLRVANLG